MQVNLAPQANADSVVRFDAVVVDKKSLQKTISKMDASAWFSPGPKGRCSYRGGPKAKVHFYSWELVPGHTFRLNVPTGAGARAVYGFAEYFTPGIHRISLPTAGKAAVEMTARGLYVQSQMPPMDTSLPVATEDSHVCPDDPGSSS